MKIAVAESNLLFRQTLVRVLSAYDWVIEAANGSELLDGLLGLPGDRLPEIVLLELKKPEKDVLETIRTIVKDYPQIKMIVMPRDHDESGLAMLIHAGVKAIIARNSTAGEVINIIEQVRKNGFVDNRDKGWLL